MTPNDLKLGYDDHGWRRATVPEGYHPVSDLLEGDIQGSENVCDIYLEYFHAVRSGARETWEGTGNACTLTLTSETARIDNEFSDESCSLPIEALQTMIEAWKAFVGERFAQEQKLAEQAASSNH
jgi:hypothetical protein